MAWPAQSPDLNTKEHLRGNVKKYVAGKQSSNAVELWITVRDSRHQIPLKK